MSSVQSRRQPPPPPPSAVSASRLSLSSAAAGSMAGSGHGSSVAASLPSAALSSSELSEWRHQSVPAVAATEASIRQQAVGKREELRQLVGVRYRVLLETADSIETMKAEGDMAQTDMLSIQAALAALRQLHTDSSTTTAATGSSPDEESSSASPLSSLRSLSSSPLSVLQSLRRRQWQAAVRQLIDSTAAATWLARHFPARRQPAHENAISGQTAAPAALPLAGRSSPLLSSQWRAVLQHRSSALAELPSLLCHHAIQALQADVILDVKVSHSVYGGCR